MASAYMKPAVNATYPCPNGRGGQCYRMVLADGAGLTGPGVSEVAVNEAVSGKAYAMEGVYNCGGDNPSVRDFSYFPYSWSNQSIAKVYSGCASPGPPTRPLAVHLIAWRLVALRASAQPR